VIRYFPSSSVCRTLSQYEMRRYLYNWKISISKMAPWSRPVPARDAVWYRPLSHYVGKSKNRALAIPSYEGAHHSLSTAGFLLSISISSPSASPFNCVLVSQRSAHRKQVALGRLFRETTDWSAPLSIQPIRKRGLRIVLTARPVIDLLSCCSQAVAAEAAAEAAGHQRGWRCRTGSRRSCPLDLSERASCGSVGACQ
jgi:hypothetical protein